MRKLLFSAANSSWTVASAKKVGSGMRVGGAKKKTASAPNSCCTERTDQEN